MTNRHQFKKIYQRLYGRGGNGTGEYEKECVICGISFTAKYPTAKYCSRRCSNDAYIERRRERKKKAREKVCESCNTEFTAKRSDAKYCSVACKQSAYRKRSKVVTGIG